MRWSHERFDGRGYPDGLAGDEIPLGSRIIAVCDRYSALVSDHPAGTPLIPREAQVELCRGAGTLFDPVVVDALCALLDDRELALPPPRPPGELIDFGTFRASRRPS